MPLEQLIGEGPGYQDWQASHVQVPDSKRRVRLYLVRAGTSAEDRQIIERAALREFQLLETLQHPGILRAYGFTEHEVGPALIFEHDPLSIRLDHFLVQNKDRLSIDTRLDLVRQIAEVVRFAHDKKVVHRALCPQSILVTEPLERPPADQGLQLAGRLPQGDDLVRASRRSSRPPRTWIAWWRTPAPRTWPPRPSPRTTRASTSTSSPWGRSPTTSSRACLPPPMGWN